MPRMSLDLSVEEIKDLVFQLSTREFLALMDNLEEKAESIVMMQLAETSFSEWDDPGEDIYDDKA